MIPVLERFLEKIHISDSGCWEWTARITKQGYGSFSILSYPVDAHRFIYEYYYGEITPKFEVHHICENKICCNPNHLKQLSVKEHNIRHLKTHCPQGHEYSIQNTYITKHGWRHCKTCHMIKERIRRNSSLVEI